MFTQKCPGQDMRYWTAEDVHEEKCPNCGEVIEFFKTDIRLRCRNCRTRVANPRFDMGCAEWCAHAEMCLGAGARGIQKKSFRAIIEEEFERLGKTQANIENVKNMINKAEEICRRENADMLPVVAAAVILTLAKLNLIQETGRYVDRLAEEHELPGEVIKETRKIIDSFQKGNDSKSSSTNAAGDEAEDKREKIVAELFERYGEKFVRPQ